MKSRTPPSKLGWNRKYSSIRNIWEAMKQRCYNPTNDKYKIYGARGIVMSAEWLDFDNFGRDMWPRPSKLHTVDRIDNDGPYSKENCKWASHKEQSNNKRNTIRLTYSSKTQPIAYWAKEFGLGHTTLWSRVKNGETPPYCFRVVRDPGHNEPLLEMIRSKAASLGIVHKGRSLPDVLDEIFRRV
jgi:hypothetical protein